MISLGVPSAFSAPMRLWRFYRNLRFPGLSFSVCLALAVAGSAGDAYAGEVTAPAASTVQRAPQALAAPTSSNPAASSNPPTPADRSDLTRSEDRKPAAGRTGSVLGLSWLPAFCETKAKRPECLGQTSERADARALTLVGLWPVRNSFCKVSEALQAQDRKRDWLALPAVPLPTELAAKLAVAMPGVASGLDRHMWLRSGSCQTLEPDAYFSLQVRLLDAVSRSAVGALFRSKIGLDISEAEVRAAFDTDFAAGAGERVRLQCRKVGDRTLVTGLTIGLSATMDEASDLATSMLGAAPIRSRCSAGLVDAAGSSRQLRSRNEAVVGTVGTGASRAGPAIELR